MVVGPRSSSRLASTVNVPATLLNVAGTRMRYEVDGNPSQEPWTREAMLIESRGRGSDGKCRIPFEAIKGYRWVYGEPQKRVPRYDTMPKGRM